MKITTYLIAALFVVNLNQARAQLSNEMQAMHCIKNFYTEYSSINPKTDKSKLDTLIGKYFTPKEGEILKRAYKKGRDIMTSDSGITNRSLETMFIKTINDEKSLNIETGKYQTDKGIKDGYEVRYVVNPVTPKLNGVTMQTLIVIYILVEKYNGVF